MAEDLTPAMREYADVDYQLKELEERKKTLRAEVIQELKDNPDKKYKGISMSTSDKVTIVEDKFFDWVASNWPDKVNLCRANKIDEEKFEHLVASKQIDYDEIPSECYVIKSVNTIRVVRRVK